MKKIVYLIMMLGVVLTSCDPMEDIHADIDAQEEVITGEIAYTLTDEDYDELDLSYGNFNSVDDAKAMLPSLLSDKYPVWGEGALVEVTFDVYAPKQDQDSIIVYTVSSDDYDEFGTSYGNFDDLDQIYDLVESKFPNPVNNMLVSLTYDYYDGSNRELNNGFFYSDNEWHFIEGFTEDEYKSMGEGYPNFSSEDEATAKIPIFLLDKFKYDNYAAGDIVATMYKLYTSDVSDLDGDGSTEDSTTYSYIKYFIFDGTSWSEYNNVAQETVKFGHDGSTWVPDNTIKYTLTAADYELVGNGYYKNFDVRAGKAEESETVRLEKINTILLNNFPDAEEGQKFSVSYNVYNGSNAVYTMNVIKVGPEYVLQ
ncbi:hypothetical protein [Aureibaculum marinum]|nr:hypothetical protein [Aureibaculum marinum]